jgi:hypothetical protein
MTEYKKMVFSKNDFIPEAPGLLPYAHTAGGAIVRPDDLGKVKSKALLAMRQQTDRQMSQLYKQMELLASQAKDINKRVEISERIYNAAIGFEPLVGETYFLYQTQNGTDILSIVAPNEWGKSFKYEAILAECYLLADHTWEVNFTENN